VGLVASTRLEWTLLDTAIALAGAVSVPIYVSLTSDHLTYILQDAGCSVAILEHPELVQRARDPAFAERLAALRHIIVLDEVGPLPSKPGVASVRLAEVTAGERRELHTYAAFHERGRAALGEHAARLDALAADLRLEDEFTYVYTSGTTGIPKGVVLSHKNLVFEAWSIAHAVPLDGGDEQLLVLPLAHIFSRHLVWGAVEQGAITTFAESIDAVAANLKEVAPTFMGAVPRIYEKVYNKIMAGVAAGSPLKQRIFHAALAVGRKVSVCRQRGQTPPPLLALQMAVADRLVFGKIKAVFGGRLRFFVSGGAPLSREIAEFFHAAGVLILEGYGLTETTGATNVNRPDRYRFGTVGPSMPGCEVRIAEDGEVLLRGHNVMVRYHGYPEETAAAIDAQGWFRSGDVGELVDGFLRITDRKKDLIKTSGGKYIAPQLLENRLKLREGISQVMVHGDNRPYAVALLTIDEVAMGALADREGLGVKGYAALAEHPRIRQVVQGYLDELNAGLASFETVKKFAIAPADFTEATGELTPSFKVKRKVVREKYASLIESLYA
jgi:long-chain acyl-CoA synthetase